MTKTNEIRQGVTPKARKRAGASPAKARERARVSRGARASRLEGADTRAAYLREVRRRDLLTAEDEQRLARRLEELEIDIWRRLLAFSPATERMLALAERAGDTPLPPFEALRSAAADVRSQRSIGACVRLARAARDAAGELRTLDRDRDHLNAVLIGLDRIDAAGGDVAPFATDPRYLKIRAVVAKAANEAARTRNRFVESNLRLVLSVAHTYARYGVAVEDLIQEGNLGLMKAVDRFDPRRGHRFSTYARWWIRHMIVRAVDNQARTVRVPVHLTQSRQRLHRVARELEAKLGRMPRSDEIAEASGLPEEKVESLRDLGGGRDVSLDKPVGEDEKQPRIEIFRDPATEEESPVEVLAARAEEAELVEVMADLPAREADILRRRFGFGGVEREWTLQEIADDYRLSRERIRQIQTIALAKLRQAIEARGEPAPQAS